MKYIKKYIDNAIITPDKMIILMFFFGIFSFLYLTGTINSGYHFIDDHGMLNIKLGLDKGSFLNISLEHITSDFKIRFRPLYYFYYVSEVQIFGVNFLALSIFTGVLAFFSFSFFYTGMRKLGHSYVSSAVFVLLMFLGPQSSVWWRLGTNETVAMFFLGLAFLFMAKCLTKEKYLMNNILFILFLSIASLCKESFIIIMPAFVLYKILNEKKYFSITLKESVKKNILSVLPMLLMLLELGLIKFVVGTNKIGYAGMTSSAVEFINGIKNILFNKYSLWNWIVLIAMLLIICLAPPLFVKEKRKVKFLESLKPILIYFYFSFLIILPNIFMHAKSGMDERYLLPTTLGLSFLAVGIIKSTKQIYLKATMFLITIIFIFGSFDIAKKRAINFADKGKETNKLLSVMKKNSKPESKILLVIEPVDRFEISYSTKAYLSFFGYNNLYAFPITRSYTTDFEKNLEKLWWEWFIGKELADMKGEPDSIVFIDKTQITQFFNESGILESTYRNVMNKRDNYAFYIKNRVR